MSDSIIKKETNKYDFPIKIFHEKYFSFSREEDWFRLILIEKGSSILKINNRSKTVIAPLLCCLNYNDVISPVSEQIEEVYALYLHPGFINKSLTPQNIKDKESFASSADRLDSDNFNIFMHTKSDDGIIEITPVDAQKIKKHILKIKREFEEKPDNLWPCRTRAAVLELLFYLMNVYNMHSENSSSINFNEDEELINKIIHYILSNLKNKITMEELVKKFNSNKTSLSKYFKEHTGESVIEYINRMRISLAERILRDTGLSLKEIMDETGFNDMTHFIRTFKKINNLTPLEFRNKSKKQKA